MGQLCTKYALKQIVEMPTRYSQSKHSCIDHIYTNRIDVISESNVPFYAVSDHLPVCFTRFMGENLQKENHTLITYRSFKEFSETDFILELFQTNFQSIEFHRDVNQSLALFYEKLHSVISKHAPLMQKRVKRLVQPGWFNENIKQLIHKRNYFYKKKDWDNYKLLRNKTTSLIRKSKLNFFNKAVAENNNINYFWQHLRLIRGHATKSTIPEVIDCGGTLIFDKTKMANKFNEHFVSISNIINKVEISNEYLTSLQCMLDKRLKNITFDIKPITPLQVKSLICKLNPNKSTGLDGIGPRILKLCGDSITTPIAFIINKSISDGTFPDSLKCASVIPLHKNQSRNDPNNYRPISILPTLSKIYERHIADQIYSFLKKYELLYANQSGFRNLHSCCTALVKMIDCWLKDVDEGKYVGALFLDLKKAFDLVDHELLIEKLKLYHFSKSAVDILKSYLTQRKQLVKLGNVKSDFLQIRSGVPQGSILGPILFLLYINDIPSYISESSSIDLYADDSTVYESGYQLENIQKQLQKTVNKVKLWCKLNNMAINSTKTKCMLISTSIKLKKCAKLNISVDNHQIENVSCQKILGVMVQENLKWNAHINHVCKKLNMKLNLLKRISPFLTHDMKKLFYNSYILSQFDYCCILWAKGSSSSLMKLCKVQKRVARLILKKPNKTPSLPLFKTLKWLTFENRVKYHIGVLVYKSLNKKAPVYITNMFTVNSVNSYCLRSSTRGDIGSRLTAPKTNYMLDTFSHNGKQLWNQLPTKIRNAKNVNCFKKLFKDYLFNRQ